MTHYLILTCRPLKYCCWPTWLTPVINGRSLNRKAERAELSCPLLCKEISSHIPHNPSSVVRKFFDLVRAWRRKEKGEKKKEEEKKRMDGKKDWTEKKEKYIKKKKKKKKKDIKKK